MKIAGKVNIEVEVSEKEAVLTMLARILRTDKYKVKRMIIKEREVNGEIGLYKEYNGSYHGSYSPEFSLITKDTIEIKKYHLLKELLVYADDEKRIDY